MKSSLKRSMLVLALLFAAHAHAELDEGGEGCLPGDAVEPIVPLQHRDSLIQRQPLVLAPGQVGGNCNSVRAQAALPTDGRGINFAFAPRDHTFQWTPDGALTVRTLYIRADSMAVFQSSAELRMEIYRQSLTRPGLNENTDTLELRVFLVRDQSGDIDVVTGHLAVSVWVIVQDINGQLGFLSTPINETLVERCDRHGHLFAACLDIVTDTTQPQLILRSARDQQIMVLPRAKTTDILLGNVATSAGLSSDRFILAHSAGGQVSR